MKKNEILILYGTEYLELTKKLLEEAQLAEMIGDSGKIIGIKPNLVAPVPAEDGGTTHPEVVEGLLQYLQEHGSSFTDHGRILGGRPDRGIFSGVWL